MDLPSTPTPYNIPDPPQDLLISFDISSTPGQGRIRKAPLTGAVRFSLGNAQQASEQDRFPNPNDSTRTYNRSGNELFLVERIEVL